MLIYSSILTFAPPQGVEQIIELIAKWMGQRVGTYIDPERFAVGVFDLSYGVFDIHSQATRDDEEKKQFPFSFCAQFSHPDKVVNGRRWIAEIGLGQEKIGAVVGCTFLLRTEEQSALVKIPAEVSRPRVVVDIIESCVPQGETPGLTVKMLDEYASTAFLAEIERSNRRHPIVVVSSTSDGQYFVNPDSLRFLLTGIADIVQIPTTANTYEIERIVGRRHCAFGGAVNVIFPPRRAGGAPETILFLPEKLRDLVLLHPKKASNEIFTAITHRTNLPYSWRCITPTTVAEATLRMRLAQSLLKVQEPGGDPEYEKLLTDAIDQLSAKDRSAAALQEEIEERNDQIFSLNAKIEGLQHGLSSRANSELDDDAVQTLKKMRILVADAIFRNPSLEDILLIVNNLFADRLVILDSAFASAREAKSFRFGKRALLLIWTLATDYWQSLADGQGDMQAKSAFRDAYAQNEGDLLSSEARKRRTFTYNGREYEMMKHLKLGAKDSISETLRVHFEWIANEQKIVVGHCGKHLLV